ncbi:MAG TPA: NAD-dependent epimerase/dehydratase family protein [Dehalococcoidia bacterium]|nr:NAD-dependent epimerase/dehydratase family protein [Dehalococcoidia bacterium]
MRILITGANGFLGSHVTERLQAQGHDLRLMLRRTSNLAFLEDVQGYERVEGDMRDTASLTRAVEGVEAVLHLSGLTTARTEAEYHAVNGTGTANLVMAAAKAGASRFVAISSLAAHGPSLDERPRPLTAPGRPVSAYGRSKWAGEVNTLAAREGIDVAVVRPSAVYGPRDKALVPLYRIAKLAGVFPLYGDGLNLASLIHVHDAADAIVSVVLSEFSSGSIYTISDGQLHTWRELVQSFSRALDRRIRTIPTPAVLYQTAGYAGGVASFLSRRALPLNPDQIRQMSQRYWVCDNTAITRDTGWKPRIEIDEGLADTLAWYRRRRWL